MNKQSQTSWLSKYLRVLVFGMSDTSGRQLQGIGWSNIQHRVDFLKGKLDVNLQPDKGTSVQIEFDI